MKRFVYKLSFVPKIPIPHVTLDNVINYDGSFFLISESPLILTDFSISDSTEFKGFCVHISHVFETFLNSEEMELISLTHAHFSQYLAFNMYNTFYTDYKLYLIPVMQIQGQKEWDSTLEWVKRFTNPPSISSIYQEILIRYDRKNQGDKLGTFFSKHGDWVNRFVRFVMSIEVPVKQFIKNSPIQNSQELTKQELVALICSLRLQEVLIDRITKKERSRRNQYSIIRSVAFNLNLSKSSCLKLLECDDSSSFKENIPLLDIVNINRNSSNEHLSYSSLAAYPLAVSQSHQRIIEVLENFKVYIQEIYQRIPENYTPPEPISLHPMEISHLSPIAPIHLSIAPLMNRISDQFYPVLKGHISIINATAKAYELIRNNLLYRFKDLKLLRMALTDTTLNSVNRKSLPTNSRLVLLGSTVLNFISSNVIFLANPSESVLRMSKMRSLIVGGEFFRHIIDKIGLSKCFISSHGSAVEIANHTAKKIIYAIFGAIFLDSNLSSCFTAFKYLLMIDNKSIAESMFVLSPLGAQTLDFLTKVDFSPQSDISNSSSVPGQSISNSSQGSSISGSSSNPQLNGTGSGSISIGSASTSTSAAVVMSSLMNEFVENHDHPINIQNVYDATKTSIALNYLPLFQAAFTHSSCSKSFTSNERLSFVGESFSKMIITMLAYRCFPTSDSDLLEYVVYEIIRKFGLIAYEKQISTLTVVQPGFEDKLAEPTIGDDYESDNISSLHTETLYAVIAAIAFACGFNAAYQFLHQDIIGLDWFTEIDLNNCRQKELEVKIKEKAGVLPRYFQYLVDGNYYSLMSVGCYRVQCVGMAKDPIVSKQDLINAVSLALESDPDIILTQEEYEELDMREASKEFPQLQYNTFDS